MRRLIAAAIVSAAAVAALSGCTAAAPTVPAAECAATRKPTTVALTDLPQGPTFSLTAAEVRGKALVLGAGTTDLRDFTPADGTVDGGVVGPGATGLIGAGATRTVLEVAPHTSTHAADIPTTFPDTNQLSVLRITGDRAVLRGFTVHGTDQGHLYNGLRVDRVRSLIASGIHVDTIPGGAASPPGETFGINDYRTTGSQWSDVVVDGAGVGASGFGVNISNKITVCRAVSRDNRYGMGFAFWRTSGVRLVDCSAIDNGRAGFNFERATGDNVLIRPVVRGNAYGIRISSDQASARFTIVDPTLTDGHLTVTVPYRYNHAANRQRPGDIVLIVGGRERPDLLRIQRY